MEIIELKGTGGTLRMEMIRSSRRSLSLQVRADERIVVRAPNRMPKREIMQFLQAHEEWIYQKREELRAITEKKRQARSQYEIPPYESLSDMEKCRIRVHFLERVRLYASRMGVSYNRVTIRNQKGRWGSCSGKGNLNFNYRLHYLPEELMDYVVVHELAHRFYMDHSGAFWGVVEIYCPDYRNCQKKLKEIGIER